MNVKKILFAIWLYCSLLGSMVVHGQGSDKQIEWNKIQQKADSAFALKDAEKKLKGEDLSSQIHIRNHAFQWTVYALTDWIDKYYPNGNDHPTTGYVHAMFLATLYLEYAGHFEKANRFYTTLLPRLIYELYNTHQSIPEYNHVSIEKWVAQKTKVLNATAKNLEANEDRFRMGILNDIESALSRASKRVDYLMSNDSFAHVVTNESDKIFAIKQIVIDEADSEASSDPEQWGIIYVLGISRNLGLSIKRDSTLTFELFSIEEQADVRNAVNTSLTKCAEKFTNKYIVDRRVNRVLFAIHGKSDKGEHSAREFNEIFGENLEFNAIEHIRSKWPWRINIVTNPINRKDDSILIEINKTALIEWIVNDFEGKHPPDWFWGLIDLYSDSSFVERESFHLFFLKTAVLKGHFPKIESFVSWQSDELNSQNIFLHGYWLYFWKFLENQGIATNVYAAIQKNAQEWTNEKSVKLFEDMSGKTIEQLNIEFKKFLQSRNIRNISKKNMFWQMRAKGFLYKGK